MAFLRTHKKQKPNDPIAARTLREMAETCDWTSRIRAAAPIGFMSTFAGAMIRYSGIIFSAYVGIVASPGPITARVTTTPGSGPVEILTFNGTTLATVLDQSSNPITITAYNISSTTGGIPAGTYVIIMKIAGYYWVITADCGN